MANEVQGVTTEIEKLVQQLEALGIVQLQQSQKLGLVERKFLKLKTTLRSNPINTVAQSMMSMGKAVTDVTTFVGNFVAMSDKERMERLKQMTVLQRLTTQFLFFGGVAKANNKILETANNRFTRLMTRVFSLISVFLIVGFALAAFSIALDGTNSPLMNMKSETGLVNDALQGMGLILSGEGDEGLSALVDIFAASVMTAAAALVIFNARMSIIVGVVTAVVGVYQLLNNETGESTIAFMGAAGAAMGLVAIIYLLRAAFIGLATGTMASASLTVAQILGGYALIMGGLVGLYAYMTGAGEGFKGFLLGLLSVIAIGVGAALLGMMSIPVAIGLALVFFVATVVRYKEETMQILGSIWDGIKKFGGLLWYGLLAGLGLVAGFIVGAFATWATIIFGTIGGIIGALVNVGVSFYNDVIKGGGSLVDWFLSIPTTLKEGFVYGFKTVFATIIDLYNDFAGKMEFDIPDWVPKIGGQTFSLPKIPALAKGGIVNSPTLAMIGEDGPEAVVPLSSRNNPNGIGLGGGGDITVNINVGGVTDRTDKRELAREIGDLIRAEMARGGRSYGNRRSAV